METNCLMKRVLVKSVFDAFEYVIDHYYPYGLEDMVQRADYDAIISIQDTHTHDFSFQFTTTELQWVLL